MQKVMNLNALVLDERLQSREEIIEEAVAQYAEDMKRGEHFPAITVFFDGVSYYVTDGFHRYHAAKRANKASIGCEIKNGTFRDAEFYALTQANKANGMRRTLGDRKKACARMLEDIEYSQYPTSKISELVGLSAPVVTAMRDAMGKTPDKVQYQNKTTGKVVERPSKNKKTDVLNIRNDEPEQPALDEAAKELIDTLTAENAALNDRLAVEAMDASEEEKLLAQQTITELRERVRVLEIELEAVKRSRDTYQNENGSMKKHIAMLQKKLKQLENA